MLDNAYTLFHEGITTLARMEQQGFRIDMEYVKSKKQEITNEIKKLENEFKSSIFYKDWSKSTKSTINIYSPVQLGKFLYGEKGIKISKETKSGQGSTDEEALQELDIPELDILLRIKRLKKNRDTYLDGFEREQVNGYIHPFFNLHLVRTYRGSSDSPNFQNIPKKDIEAMEICRKAIYPRPKHQLIEIDFKQLEVRIAACYCEDERLIKDILEGDMHRDMAIELFKIKEYNPKDPTHKVLRQAAKNGFVFPEFYGDYYRNCAVYLAHNWGQLPKNGRWKKGKGIPFEDKHLSDHLIANGFKELGATKKYNDVTGFAKHVKDVEKMFWTQRYRTYLSWKEWWWNQYQINGYFESKTGFTYRGVMSKNDVINYPIQGSAFHCLLWSLNEGMKVQLSEHWDTKIIGQIHDAIILDVNPKELDHVIKVMKCIMCNDIRQKWKWITVPLDVDVDICEIDKSWAEKNK